MYKEGRITKSKANSMIKIGKVLIYILFLFFYVFGNIMPARGDISISVTIPGPSPTPVPVFPGGGGGGGNPLLSNPAKVIFRGMAYPGAHITILKNSYVAGTVTASATGDFNFALTGLPQGLWSFGFFAEDTEGRKSVTMSFSTNILGGTDTVISGIFISPTISLSGIAAKKGDDMDIYGQAYPASEVNLFVASPVAYVKKTSTDAAGKWKYVLKTDELEAGVHTARAKAIIVSGDQSSFSEEMVFKLIDSCQGADLNFDGKINLVDFSILLYFWKQEKPSNICSDINSDRSVDLTDFSIMMYWWNG